MSCEVVVMKSEHKAEMKKLMQILHEEEGLQAAFYWPLDVLGAELATADGFVAVLANKIVGYILYRDSEPAWEISLLVTHPHFRRQRVMEQLLRQMIDAKSQGKQIWLEVHEENLPAQKLYEKLGFKETRRRPRYYKDGATAILYSHA